MRESPAIKALHRTGVESQDLRREHQILASQTCTLRRPPEQFIARERGHPDRLPPVQAPEERSFDQTENAEWAWHEQDPADLCRSLVVADFLFGESARSEEHTS